MRLSLENFCDRGKNATLLYEIESKVYNEKFLHLSFFLLYKEAKSLMRENLLLYLHILLNNKPVYIISLF